MDELWMRVGMTFRLTEEEVDSILNPKNGEISMRTIIRIAFDEGRFELDGDTYVPEATVEEYNAKHGTDYEVGEYECSL